MLSFPLPSFASTCFPLYFARPGALSFPPLPCPPLALRTGWRSSPLTSSRAVDLNGIPHHTSSSMMNPSLSVSKALWLSMTSYRLFCMSLVGTRMSAWIAGIGEGMASMARHRTA